LFPPAIDLNRYETKGILGSGADYEVIAADDRETGEQVVLKRPKPQMISRGLHTGIDERTEHTLEAYQLVGATIPLVTSVLGYTERTLHDEYFEESLGQEYRVTVERRALGIPLVGDPMARITGVPIGVGQNLFTLFPLVEPEDRDPFGIHRQLLDVEERFLRAGYVLLDLRPQNVFYQPGNGHITVIDCGGLVNLNSAPPRRGGTPPDIHDFYLEMLKFYATAQTPPSAPAGYRDPYGLRPVVNFQQELDDIGRKFGELADPAGTSGRDLAQRVRDRQYTDFDNFRQDLITCLANVGELRRALPGFEVARGAWTEALQWLREEYWGRYLFDPDIELIPFQSSNMDP
jgi:hypothetical protein